MLSTYLGVFVKVRSSETPHFISKRKIHSKTEFKCSQQNGADCHRQLTHVNMQCARCSVFNHELVPLSSVIMMHNDPGAVCNQFAEFTQGPEKN